MGLGPRRAWAPPGTQGSDGKEWARITIDSLHPAEPRQLDTDGLSPRRTRRLIHWTSIVIAVSAIIQLGLGANVAVLVLALGGAYGGLWALRRFGARNLAGWLAFFYAAGNVVVPLLAKTLLAQPLDSHLTSPTSSFAYVSLATLAIGAAAAVAERMPVGRPLFAPLRDPDTLAFISWSCLVLGLAAFLANRSSQDPGGSGFGGLALFRDLLLMAVIARCALLLERSGGRQSLDAILVVMIGAATIAGLFDNAKTYVALPVVSYFVTSAVYRRTLSRAQLSFLVVGGIAFTLLVAPFVHAMRALGQQDLTVAQRTQLLTSIGGELRQGYIHSSDLESLAQAQFQRGYYSYFGDEGAGQMLLGRYASVQQVDPVIHEASVRGQQGSEAIWPALGRLVPSAIAPGKPQYPEAYYTLVAYGLIDPAGGKYPTLPLVGQSYAAYGPIGAVVIPFVTFLAFLVLLKKWGWDLRRNIFAIFIVCDFVLVYANQGDFGQYAGMALRGLPEFGLVFLGLLGLNRLRVRLPSRRILAPRQDEMRSHESR